LRLLDTIFSSKLLSHPKIQRYTALINEDLTATYSRDIQKWLLVAPIIGIATGLVITGIALLILDTIWVRLLPYYILHHWAILVGLAGGFLVTGLIMQYCTPDPDEHSTEEIIRSYHEHQGDIDVHPFWWKLLAAVTTVGSGGSAALEGPSIYGGGAIGSWLWTKLRGFGLEPKDRRIMLISGAAAGMAAVFRAPLTGLVFALEMPYKDDLAHEALLPSLISSVVAYSTLVAIVGSKPLFGFAGSTSFRTRDLFWSAALGVIIGLVSIVYDITFRRVRRAFVSLRVPHTVKLLIGGVGTAICGLIFVNLYTSPLIPIGPNYEAVREILARPHPSGMLVVFSVLKLLATIFSLGSGGVSAMFVPLLLVGGCIGNAFGQSVARTSAVDLYAAVGMAAFIAGGYKTPLTAVVFVAETTGGHSYLIPSLIGAAVAYAVSGEASVSGDQHLHEAVKIEELTTATVAEVMQREVVGVQASASIGNFAASIAARHRHTIFPVFENQRVIGTISTAALSRVSPDKWDEVKVGQLARRDTTRVPASCDLSEALRLLVREGGDQMLLITDDDGKLAGVVTKTDILRSFQRPSHAPTQPIPHAAGGSHGS
jgi:CIC family chloride channel protein